MTTTPPPTEPPVADDVDPPRPSPPRVPPTPDKRTASPSYPASSPDIPLAHQQHTPTRAATPTRGASPVPSIASSTESGFPSDYWEFMRTLDERQRQALGFERTDGERGKRNDGLDLRREEEKQRWEEALSKATTASRGKDPDHSRRKNDQTTPKRKGLALTQGTNSRTTPKGKEPDHTHETNYRPTPKGQEPDNTQGTISEVELRVAEERERWRAELLRAANASVSKMEELKNALKACDAALALAQAENDSCKAELAMLKAVAGREWAGTMSSEEKKRFLQAHMAMTVATSQENAVNMQKTIAALERDLQHVRVESRMRKGDIESLAQALSDAKKREKSAVEEGESPKRALKQSTMHNVAMKNSLETLHKQHIAVVQQLGEARRAATANTDPLQTVIADLQRENQQFKLSDARLHAYNVAIYQRLQECQANLAAERSKRQSASDLGTRPAPTEAEDNTPIPPHSIDSAGATDSKEDSKTGDTFNSAQQASHAAVRERLSLVEATLEKERALLVSSTEE
jgi:hypothetical protein